MKTRRHSTDRGRRHRPGEARALVSALLLAGLGCATVPPGHGAVVTSPWGGVNRNPLTEGTFWTAPGSQVDVLDLRVQEAREDLRAVAADGAPIQANSSVVTWHIVRGELVEFDRTVGPDPYARIIRPIVQSAVRRVVARYPAFELMDVRNIPALEAEISKLAASHARGLHVVVDGVVLRSITVTSPALQAQFVDTSRLEQTVLQMRHELELARARREQAAARARAEADANAVIAPGLTPEAVAHSAIEAWTQLLRSPGAEAIAAPATGYVLEVSP